MKNIIFIAPPAAGKGTQSKLLNEKYHLPHISTGDLLREEVNNKTELGSNLEMIMQEGKLVSDEIVLNLLEKRLENNDTDIGFILDGFPRNLVQATKLDELLDKINKEIDYVIALDLDKETAKNRIVGRTTCSKCGHIYNDLFEEMSSKIKGICDIDGASLVKRADDNIETLEKRYTTYLEQTKPLIDYYTNKGLIYHIDSSLPKITIFKQIIDILEKGSND